MKVILASACVAVQAGISGCGDPPAPPSVAVALQQTEDIAKREAAVGRLTPEAMRAEWETCRAFILNNEAPDQVRIALATRVLKAGDAETMGKVLDILIGWESQANGHKSARDPMSSFLVNIFRKAASDPAWAGWKTNANAALRLLEVSPMMPGCGNEYRKADASIVSDAPIPNAVKGEWALRAILAQRSTGSEESALLSMIDERGVGQLREALAASVRSGAIDDYASTALAHIGDEQSLPLLHAYVEKREGYQRAMNELLPYKQWQIEVQHPPTKILEWFKSGVEMQNAWYARWAAPRALELGFTKDQLRDALLTFERSLPDETVQAGPAKNNQLITRRPSVLIDLQADMIKAGVLTPSDWKKVPSNPALQLGQ